LRRVDQGTLSDDQIERIGSTLMALESRMAELRDHFGLAPEDLNLDLGPLGRYCPTTTRPARDLRNCHLVLQPPGPGDQSTCGHVTACPQVLSFGPITTETVPDPLFLD
jgi:hypothetical protein